MPAYMPVKLKYVTKPALINEVIEMHGDRFNADDLAAMSKNDINALLDIPVLSDDEPYAHGYVQSETEVVDIVDIETGTVVDTRIESDAATVVEELANTTESEALAVEIFDAPVVEEYKLRKGIGWQVIWTVFNNPAISRDDLIEQIENAERSLPTVDEALVYGRKSLRYLQHIGAIKADTPQSVEAPGRVNFDKPGNCTAIMMVTLLHPALAIEEIREMLDGAVSVSASTMRSEYNRAHEFIRMLAHLQCFTAEYAANINN